jgi:hypothetical protein
MSSEDPAELPMTMNKELLNSWEGWLAHLPPEERMEMEYLAQLESTSQLSSTKAEEPKNETKNWHLIRVPDLGAASSLTFETLPELLKVLKASLTRKYLQVFIFHGEQAFVSKGPFKYLMLPDGTKEPLFNKPEDLQPAKDGRISAPPETFPFGLRSILEEEPEEDSEDGTIMNAGYTAVDNDDT